MPIVPVSLSHKRVSLHKAIVSPVFGQRSVLTNSPWTFVDLWLKRENKQSAIFYWEQARNFYEASKDLPMHSSPLLLYYAFMNAAKALLEAKGIPYSPYHGVSIAPGKQYKRISLATLRIEIKQNGITPAISSYFGEVEPQTVHSMEDLLYNLPFIHRTYCLTYTSRKEMFLPLKNCEYVRDETNGHVFFRAELSEVDVSSLRNKLPPGVVVDSNRSGVRSSAHVVWAKSHRASRSEVQDLSMLNQKLRANLQYINGTETLWYLKTTGPRRLHRCSPTIVLAAMHRLSEICRYRPIELVAFMNGQKNWLLSEFVAMASVQFFDEIASEITGYQFLIPNVRSPT